MSNQFLRKCSLSVYGVGASGASGAAAPSAPITSAVSPTTGATVPTVVVSKVAPPAAVPGLDLSQFRIQFQVSAMDVDEPPTARIRVYNLANATVQKIQNEFQNVSLQAGYEGGNFGVIFQGSIVRIRKGALSNIDTFVDIIASNFDAVYNFGVVSKTAKAGTTLEDRLNLIKQGVADSPAAKGSPNALAAGMQYGNIPSSFGTGGTLPRGKVMFGLAREHLNAVTDSGLATWSIGPDGKVNVKKLDETLPGPPIVITSQTGMVGVPEATQQGIEVNCLLNPLIKTGSRIQLDNSSLNTTVNKLVTGFPSLSSLPSFFANTSEDGVYMALVVEHEGDNRGHGNDWLTKITALSVDQSSGTVQSYGWQGS